MASSIILLQEETGLLSLYPLSMLSLLVPFFIFVYFFIKWLHTTASPTTTKKLPPSPPKFPIIGNLHQLGSHPHRCLWSLAQRYGPLMQLHLGSVPVVIVSSAEAAREIMKTHDVIFSSRPKDRMVARLLYDYKDVSAAPYGEYWRQMRSISVLHLLSNRRVQSFSGVRREETSLLLEKIEESSSVPVDLSGMFMRLTNDVICRVAFGRKYSGDEVGKKFRRLLEEFVGLFGRFRVGVFIPWLAWVERVNGFDAKVDRVAREFDEFLDGVVEEHLDRQEKERNGDSIARDDDQKDFLEVLLEIQRDKTCGFSIDGDSIKAVILDMFVGGTDTTYTVLEWAMTRLLRHPKVMEKLENEVRGIGRGKPLITEGDLETMQYLKAVIKETLRLHPPIPLLVPRESTQDATIMGYHIEAGTTVLNNAWAIGRDPMSWEEAEEFRPERFLNSRIDFRGQDFELIPFGAGRRGCPGVSLAMATDELVLANLVNKFDWALPGGAKAEDLDMTEFTGFTIHRNIPLIAVANPTSRRIQEY